MSNNEEYFCFITTFEVKVYSAKDPSKEPRVFSLPKPEYKAPNNE